MASVWVFGLFMGFGVVIWVFLGFWSNVVSEIVFSKMLYIYLELMKIRFNKSDNSHEFFFSIHDIMI